jgi:peptidoglycan-N-acetylglucosamine deacetylase
MKKIAYLTIDDAPSKNFRKKVDYLLAKNIPAVFFCQGNLLKLQTEGVIHAIKMGFIIGNHAYDHTHFSDLTVEQCFDQIKKTDEIINGLYKKAGVRRPAKFFRFPHGDKGGLKYGEVFEPYEGEGKTRKRKIQSFLKKLGYTQPRFKGITYKYYRKAGLLKDIDWHWTYDTKDWATLKKEPPSGIDCLEKVLERMDENVPEGERGLNYPKSEEIIIAHDFVSTNYMFKSIIERLLSKGITFRKTPLR